MESITPKKRSRCRWPVSVAVVVILIGCVVSLVLWNKPASEKFAKQIAESHSVDADAEHRNIVLGTHITHDLLPSRKDQVRMGLHEPFEPRAHIR